MTRTSLLDGPEAEPAEPADAPDDAPARGPHARWYAVGAALLVVALVAGVLVVWRGADDAAGVLGLDQDVAPPRPQVVGRTLVDARTGSPWVPQGVTWTGFASACAEGWGYSPLDPLGDDGPRDQAALLASWGIDTVRLTLNLDCWSATYRGAPASDAFHARTAEGYRAAVATFVDALHEAGLAVVLALDTRAAGGATTAVREAWPDSSAYAFWQNLAEDFADDPSVMFELWAHPGGEDGDVSWAEDGGRWRDGTGATGVGMSDLLGAVRSRGATQPVLLPGLRGEDLGSWLGVAPADDQLVATFSPTPGGACDDAACWRGTVAALAEVVPVLATEVSAGEDGAELRTARAFTTFARDRGVGVLLGWWRAGTADAGSLVTDVDGTPTAWGRLGRDLLTTAP
ncbi:cellulase family glycosylhydrolase [Nocardioides bruguierae]|uniref:cellulase family glycosylhydrolase n=1 Tax=Nocardioides bruguierae TaxID=2945102 RepID=UPI002021A1A1|nr:cellulase family glycosylhydrolase [Nocardioides bruguierae]MCL8024599.1 glycoside hydrolase family 5 protein [Nocardioides bruguierae]